MGFWRGSASMRLARYEAARQEEEEMLAKMTPRERLLEKINEIERKVPEYSPHLRDYEFRRMTLELLREIVLEMPK